MMISNTPTSSTDASNLLTTLKNNTSSATSSDTSTTSGSNDPNDLASEQTFLQLFVAQLQNQDPLDPNEQDPTQMVSELAQFSQLEQLVNIGQNVQSIDQAVAPASASGTTSTQTPAAGESSSAVNTNSNQTI